MSSKTPPSRNGAPASSSRPASTRIRARAQDKWLELDEVEYEQLLAFRDRRRREASTGNPAAALSRQLESLPKLALLSAPAIWTRLAQVKNVLEIVFFGFRDFDGCVHRLRPADAVVLLYVMAVKLKLVRLVGPLDAENLAQVLGYSVRTTRDALRALEELCLLEISRRHSRAPIQEVTLVSSLMDVPLRERRSCPQGTSRRERLALDRQKTADLISERPSLNDNPLPLRGAPPFAPAGRVPQTPYHGEEETDLRERLAAIPQIVETAAELDPVTEQPPHPIEAAVSPSNGYTRQRLQGANDHSRGAPVPSWWRSLLDRAGLGGPAPPS